MLQTSPNLFWQHENNYFIHRLYRHTVAVWYDHFQPFRLTTNRYTLGLVVSMVSPAHIW